VKEREIDAGGRPARTTEEPAQIKTLEKNAELEPANETIVRGDAGPESSRGMPIFPGMQGEFLAAASGASSVPSLPKRCGEGQQWHRWGLSISSLSWSS
jgi:hypothetical protein